MRVSAREKYQGNSLFPTRVTSVALSLFTMLWLAGCESSTTVPAGSTDSIQSPSETAPVPTPTVTATPTPTPTVTPTPTPSPTPTPTGNVTDLYTGSADLAKYVSKFVDDAKIQGVNVLPDMANPKLEIRIGTLDSYGSSVIGLCESGTNLRRVTLDPDFWNTVPETQRELLMHHELGHCVLYRAHRTAVLSGGAYASIMYPIIMASSTYLNNYDYYQEELFTYAATAAGTVGTDDKPVVHVCDHDELRSE